MLGERDELFAWGVMSNHVHVCSQPSWEWGKLRRDSRDILPTDQHASCCPGAELWQDESYDHWSRDEEEMFRIIQYIENNPVAAHLCTRPEEWPWSSGTIPADWPPGRRCTRGRMP